MDDPYSYPSPDATPDEQDAWAVARGFTVRRNEDDGGGGTCTLQYGAVVGVGVSQRMRLAFLQALTTLYKVDAARVDAQIAQMVTTPRPDLPPMEDQVSSVTSADTVAPGATSTFSGAL